MLVKRLREVRVLQSFTRVHAAAGPDDAQRLSKLSLSDVGWLPGIEVIGEGVFISLDGAALTEWTLADQTGHRTGASSSCAIGISRFYGAARRWERKFRPLRSQLDSFVHTLAHALINEWSLEAGYPAASLRERLFVSEDMAGLLIYTATSDSAGSSGWTGGSWSSRQPQAHAGVGASTAVLVLRRPTVHGSGGRRCRQPEPCSLPLVHPDPGN